MKSVAGLATLVATVVAFASPGFASAQDTPSVQQLTEQLQQAPLTRGLRRNLSVESTTERPSVSLLIQFDFDSARVRPESEQTLRNLADALRSPALEHSRFAVEGHTDAKGGATYNQALSQRRAEAVRDLLVRDGVEAARLAPAGKGATELADRQDPYAAANRRVRVVNLD